MRDTPHLNLAADDDRAWYRGVALPCLAAAWLALLGGFLPEMHHRLHEPVAPYPWIVHAHAVAFTGWLIIVSVQAMLAARGRTTRHRELGRAGAFLALGMLGLGPATAIVMHRLRLAGSGDDIAFLSVQLTDIVAFAGLAGAGLLLRRRPEAHRRLMLLATIYLTDAGFARIASGGVGDWLGDGAWQSAIAIHGGPALLALVVILGDFVLKRRLQRATAVGVAWMAGNQATGIALWWEPAWADLARRLVVD